MKSFLKLSVLFVFMLWGMSLWAQKGIADMTAVDYMNLRLPPLDELFENARQSSLYKRQEATENYEKLVLKSEKRDFLSYFNIRSGYQYGYLGTYSVIEDSQMPIPPERLATNASSNYYVGASLSIPLNNLFNTKNKIKRQQEKVRVAEFDKEALFDDQKVKIIDVYSQTVLYLSLLKSGAEAVELAKSQYEITEREFVNGRSSSGDLSEAKSRHMRVVQEYETTRAKLNTALLTLEVMTATKILIR